MSYGVEKIKVVYIASLGHSGSTVLDLIIGSAPEVFSVGELKYFEHFVTQKAHHLGSALTHDDAGFTPPESPVWGPIVSASDRYIPDEKKLAKPSFFDRLRIIFFGSPKTKPHTLEYESLLPEIVKHAQSQYPAPITTLVDSSKSLGNLIELANCPNVDLYVIHLVRDVRGVAYSYQKSGVSIWRTAFEWVVLNRAIGQYVRKNLPADRHMSLRYEALVQQPEETIRALNDFTGLQIDEENYVTNINEKTSFRFCGNGIRWKAFEGLRADVAWRSKLSSWQQRLLGFLNRWY